MLHEGAALRTPIVLIAGPINEAIRVAGGLAAHGAGPLLRLEEVDAAALPRILDDPAACAAFTAQAHLVGGGEGVLEAAA